MTFKKTAGEFVFNIAKKVFKGNKPKTTGTEVVQPFQYKTGRSGKELAVSRAEIESKKKNNKFFSDIEKSFTGLDEARIKLKQTGQRIAGEPVTKSGVSKGANIKNPKPIKKAKGGRVGLKFGSKKSNVQKIQETFGPKKKVPNKFKGFSKLPEKVQQKIDAKLAKKV